MQKFLLYLVVVFFASCAVKSPAPREYTPETANLLSNLKTISKKHILFGHQDATAYGVFWKDEEGRSDLKELIGAYPAVYGWDLGHVELGKRENLDGVSFDLIRREIVNAYERGGLSTISWHLRNPVNDSSAW